MGGDRLPQIGLDILLLQIVHRPELFIRAVGHVEFKDLAATIEAAPGGPAKRLVEERRQRADPFEDVKAGPRDTDGAAAIVERVLAIHKQHGHALCGKAQGGGHADRAGTGHDDPVAPLPRRIRTRRAEPRIGEVKRVCLVAPCRSHAGNDPSFTVVACSKSFCCILSFFWWDMPDAILPILGHLALLHVERRSAGGVPDALMALSARERGLPWHAGRQEGKGNCG